jgi:hypothetical protein
VVTLQLAILAAVGVPWCGRVAVPAGRIDSRSCRYALVAIPAIAFWRSTMNLQGHAKVAPR